jgi:hypothetical protein
VIALVVLLLVGLYFTVGLWMFGYGWKQLAALSLALWIVIVRTSRDYLKTMDE